MSRLTPLGADTGSKFPGSHSVKGTPVSPQHCFLCQTQVRLPDAFYKILDALDTSLSVIQTLSCEPGHPATPKGRQRGSSAQGASSATGGVREDLGSPVALPPAGPRHSGLRRPCLIPGFRAPPGSQRLATFPFLPSVGKGQVVLWWPFHPGGRLCAHRGAVRGGLPRAPAIDPRNPSRGLRAAPQQSRGAAHTD